MAQDKLTRVRIAYPSGGICCLALYGGIQWKIFEENGLHVEIVQIRSQIGNMALMANEIQYFSGVGPGFGERNFARHAVARRLVRVGSVDLFFDGAAGDSIAA